MAKLVLVKYSDNYADEFDISGFLVMKKKHWEKMKKKQKKVFEEDKSYSYCFGTNEEIDYDDYSDWLESFSVSTISKKEYRVLKDLDLCGEGFFASA